jgi:hypothetical protein
VTDEKPSNVQTHTHIGRVDSAGKVSHNNRVRVSRPLAKDLAKEIKGMYRLLDLISESGSNGCGKEPSQDALVVHAGLTFILVDKVIIAQDSLEQFINTICPGAYASVTKVDFKTLDQFMIKPVGVYGSKIEIIRLLRSFNVVNEDMYVLFVFQFRNLLG